MTIGERIRNLRRANNMTAEELSALLNKSSTAISYYERNNREPSVETIVRMSEVFGVTTDYLLKGEDTDITEPAQSTQQKQKQPPSEKIRLIFTDAKALEQVIATKPNGSIKIFSPARYSITVLLSEEDSLEESGNNEVTVKVKKLPIELTLFN